MVEFKVGDKVLRTTDHMTWAAMHKGSEWIVAGVTLDEGTVKLTFAGQPRYAVFYASMYELIQEAPQLRRMEAHKEEYRARANDPATSKGKRKVNKYEQAVLDMLRGGTHGYSLAKKSWALTGKEIAEQSGHPLNCITPRFAPLRRKGLIKDSGVKRDKQIVWVLA